jgi:hypothetical protein
LLSRLQCGHFLIGCAFEIHCEPNGPDDQADNASSDVLSGFQSLFAGKFFDFGVVG